MRFESAHFKLSHEMTQLLDPSGVMKSETWNLFVRYRSFFLCCISIFSCLCSEIDCANSCACP